MLGFLSINARIRWIFGDFELSITCLLTLWFLLQTFSVNLRVRAFFFRHHGPQKKYRVRYFQSALRQ